jgi:hypothetical protein
MTPLTQYRFRSDAGDEDPILASSLEEAASIAARLITPAQWRDGAHGWVYDADGVSMAVTRPPAVYTVGREILTTPARPRHLLRDGQAIAVVNSYGPAIVGEMTEGEARARFPRTFAELDAEREHDNRITFDDPRAGALRAWLNANFRSCQDSPVTDTQLAVWLDEAENGQGVVEIRAWDSVSGHTATFDVEKGR